MRPSLRVSGVDWPLFAIFGALGTGARLARRRRPEARARWAGLGWLAVGLIGYVVYRRVGLAPAADRDVARPGDHRAGGRARIQEHPRAREAGPGLGGGDRPGLPPRRRPRRHDRGAQRGRRAARPAARHRLEEEERAADEPSTSRGDRRALRREVHGADRQGPPRRPGDRRRGEAPPERDHRHGRAARPGRGRGVFSDTVDFVLKQRPAG